MNSFKEFIPFPEDTAPSAEQELHTPREHPAVPLEEYPQPLAEYAPPGEEYPAPGQERHSPSPRRRTSRFLAMAMGILLTATIAVSGPGAAASPVAAPSATPVSAPAGTARPDAASQGSSSGGAAVSTPADTPASLSDAEILLSVGTWAADPALYVHFDENGGWWEHEGYFGLMRWEEDADGHVAYSGFAAMPTTAESDSGSYSSTNLGACEGVVSLDRGDPENYRIAMDNPLGLTATSYTGGACPADASGIAALYGIDLVDYVVTRDWTLSPLEGLDEILAQARQDANRFNRQIIWVSDVRFQGGDVTLTLSDIYGGSQEYACTVDLARATETSFLIVLPEGGLSYFIADPEMPNYSQSAVAEWATLPCRIAVTETGVTLMVPNPFWSWLYQTDHCLLTAAE